MFKTWRLENVKSYAGNHVIPLSMINVVAGANSSGKSTIIQSILLLKQTLQYGNSEKSLLLNGPLLRLGSFDEVLTACASEEEFLAPTSLGIGFDLTFTQEAMGRVRRQWLRANSILMWNSLKTDYLSRVSCDVTWTKRRSSDEPAGRHVRLLPDVATTGIGATTTTKDGDNHQRLEFKARATGDSGFGPFAVDMDTASSVELGQNRPDGKPVSGHIDRFLPQYVGIYYNLAAKNAAEISAYIFEKSTLLGSTNSSKHSSLELPIEVRSFIAEWLTLHGHPTTEAEVLTVEAARQHVYAVIPDSLMFGLASLTRPSSDLERSIIQGKESTRLLLIEKLPNNWDYDFALPSDIRNAIQAIQEIFREGVRYLGPLRDPPRPVYPLEALPSSTDVGYRGEHTAAVLDLNRDERVTYVMPPSDTLESDYISTAVTRTHPLHEAVGNWLQYLGVAEHVQTHDESVFGTRLQVSTDAGVGMHDLTNVRRWRESSAAHRCNGTFSAEREPARF